MAGALRWGIIPQLHPPMSHGPVTMIRTASGSMNGDITATIWPLWNRIFSDRVKDYQRLYYVGIVQTEAPGLYKYYSTQRPVDIGTFPKPPHNAPDEIVNYDRRIPVEGGAFLAWGHLTYTRPLTEKEASDYELRPASVISELSRKNDNRPLSIAQQMKEAGALAEASQGDPIHKKKAPDRGRPIGGFVWKKDITR